MIRTKQNYENKQNYESKQNYENKQASQSLLTFLL